MSIILRTIQSNPIITGLVAAAAAGAAAFVKSRYTPKTDPTPELSKNILDLEKEVVLAQSLGTFSVRSTEFIKRYDACQKLLAKLPFAKLPTELSSLTYTRFLITTPQTFTWHMNCLSEVITGLKADNQFEQTKPLLIERYSLFHRAATLLGDSNNLPIEQLDRLENLYDAVMNRTPPKPVALPPVPPIVTTVVASPYSRLNCDSEGSAIISELLTDLGTKSYWRLLPNATHLYSLGSKLRAKDVHPFKFMETVFSNPTLKGHMKTVYEDTPKRLAFVGGLKDGLDRRRQMGDLERYLPDFAARMGVSLASITPFFRDSNWDGLLKFFIYR